MYLHEARAIGRDFENLGFRIEIQERKKLKSRTGYELIVFEPGVRSAYMEVSSALLALETTQTQFQFPLGG